MEEKLKLLKQLILECPEHLISENDKNLIKNWGEVPTKTEIVSTLNSIMKNDTPHDVMLFDLLKAFTTKYLR